MVNVDLIEAKLAQLAGYLLDLAEIKDTPVEKFNSDKIIQRYIERTLHLAIECCLDIGNHIIADENWREPNDKKDIFTVLMENSVISAELLPSLLKMAKFRNILVHDYAKIDSEILYGVLQENLTDLKEFARSVASAIKSV